MDAEEKSVTQVVRDGLEKACQEFSIKVRDLGFERSKKMFWTRERSHTVEFVHFHRSGSSYGAARNYSVDIRVHFGIRILGDPSEALALNGPSSDPTLTRLGNYHLRFNAKSGSTYERCIDDLLCFVSEQGEPWFFRFQSPINLLTAKDSPIQGRAMDSLRAAINGERNPDLVAASKKFLGIKDRK